MYRKPFLFGIRGPANNSYTSPSALFAEARFLSGHCRHANTRAELGRSGQPWAWWHSAMTAARGSAQLLAYLCCFPGSTSRAGRPRPVSCQRWELPARAGCRPPSPQGNDAAPSWGQRGGWQGSCRSYPLERLAAKRALVHAGRENWGEKSLIFVVCSADLILSAAAWLDPAVFCSCYLCIVILLIPVTCT